jgi:hypothetical protein
VSLATSLYRAAMTGLLAAAREIHDHGTCNYLEDTLPRADLYRVGRRRVPRRSPSREGLGTRRGFPF